MASDAPPVVGILAGGGSVPREIAEKVVARGGKVHIVALAGEADDRFGGFPVSVCGWAEIGGMIDAFRNAGCTELVIVGGVRRPDLAALRPDWGFVRNLPAIARIIGAGGDDGVLTRVVRFFEAQGFRVVSPAAAAPELLVGGGPLGRVQASPAEADDIALGFDLVARLGPFDVGQAVVVAAGGIEAVEGAEGTDRMLARLAHARARQAGALAASGVLVKRPKPGQELRIDLPAIGPATVRRAAEAGLAGIAVQAGGALAAERDKLIACADAAGLFVQGVSAPAPASAVPAGPSAASPDNADQERIVPARVGRWGASSRQHSDALKGAALLAAAAPLLHSAGAVVDRGHVLAVESGEGVGALIERAAGLRQWGRQRFAGRSGVAVLAELADLRTGLARAAAYGLAGVAVVSELDAARAAIGREFLREADRLGIFITAIAPQARSA